MAAKRPKPKVDSSPSCSCLLICDDVVVRHGRDKHLLEGVIGTIGVPRHHPYSGGFVIYGKVSNVHLQQSITVSFECADSEEVLWSFEA